MRKCYFQYCLNLHLLLWVKLNTLRCLRAIFLSLSMKCLLRSFACFSIQYLLILLLYFKELSLDQEYTSVFDRRCRYVPLLCRCLWAFACRGFYFRQRISGISLVTMTYNRLSYKYNVHQTGWVLEMSSHWCSIQGDGWLSTFLFLINKYILIEV